MIKAIITDIDGVILGDKKGFSFPKPHREVMSALEKLDKKGIPIVLCTGKASYVIEDLIRDAHLNNPHIGDGGTLIFNPIEGKIIRKHVLEADIIKQIVHLCVSNNVHVSVNTISDTYTDFSHNPAITEKRKGILEKDLIVSPSLEADIDSLEIIKIIATLPTQEEVEQFKKLINPFMEKVNLMWTHHPMSGSWTYAVMTTKGISKLSAAKEVAKILEVNLSDVLGIGDTLGDWIFMEECGYVGVVGDSSSELIEKAKTKGQGKYFLAPSVNENGMLDLLKYFGLLKKIPGKST